MDINGTATLLLNNQITFTQFHARTEPLFKQMAANLHRHWRIAPNKLGIEDTVQNMFVASMKALDSWNASRGMPLGNYITFCVKAAAKREIHRARGVPRLRDGYNHKSCGDQPNSQFIGPDVDEGPLERASVDPGQTTAELILDAMHRAQNDRDGRIIADLIHTYYNGESAESVFSSVSRAQEPDQTDAGLEYDKRLAAARKVVARMTRYEEPKNAIAS